MSSGALSQDEIDAMLAGVWPGGDDEKKESTVEVLSQDEIGQILTAINSSPADSRFGGGVNSKPVITPDIFSKEQLSAFSLIHEKFAVLAADSLTQRLNMPVNIKVASCDELYLEEFLRSLPAWTVIGIINMEPLNGSAIIEIDPINTSAIIDRICGGKGEPLKSKSKLTGIGKKIMESIYAVLLDNMREAWSIVINLQCGLKKIETDYNFARITAYREFVVLVSMVMTIGGDESLLNVCIPYPVIEPILRK